MNKNKVIALDLDSTLIALRAIQKASEILKYGPYDETHVLDWEFKKVFPEDFRHMVLSLFSDEKVMCDEVVVIPGVQEKLWEWHEAGYQLHIVTSRVEKIRAKTVEMVSKLFPQIIAVHFVDFGESKKETLKKLNPIIYVDDNCDNVRDSVELGIKTFLVANKFTKYNERCRLTYNCVKCLSEIEI